jgi:transposase
MNQNLGRAYANFFEDLKKYRRGEMPWKRVRVPKFKKKGKTHDSFRADNGRDAKHPDAVAIDGKRVKLPVIGWVKMREEVRFAGQIVSVTVSREADAATIEPKQKPRSPDCTRVRSTMPAAWMMRYASMTFETGAAYAAAGITRSTASAAMQRFIGHHPFGW